MTLRYAFSHILTFVIVFLLGALALNAILRANDLTRFDRGRMDFKIDLYLQEYADSDVLFLGTSRTDRQIDIAHFQDISEESGCDLSAFNLGVPNLTYEEMLYVLDRIQNANPKYMIIEEPIYAQHEWAKIETDRLRSFSTWTGTKQRLDNIWSYQEDLMRKIYRTGVTLAAFAYEQSNIGHLSRVIFPESNKGGEEIILPEALKEGRGYVSMNMQGAVDYNIAALHDKFQNEKNRFEKSITNQNVTQSKYNPALRADLIQEITSKSNSKHLILFPPLLNRVDDNLSLEQSLLHQDIHVLNYNNPKQYPQFWTAENWYDEGHLNEKSARELTSLIAKDLCLQIKGGL